ncbi:RING finger-containing protein [Cryptosporidium canis]|uniref:RING finger-containing protein n=1 Tax=Cryptosporidium canis TaxID=195482 RepID=A0ABQ8PAL1_9CRYT|nr:RING finger-containing protein [Cryptosporidium canis]
MNLQGQKRGLSQNRINNCHYLNGKRNTVTLANATSTGITQKTTCTGNHLDTPNGIVAHDDSRFKTLSGNSKHLGFSSSISTKMKYNMEEDENSKLSSGFLQQVSNSGLGRHQNVHHARQNEALGANQMGMNHSVNYGEQRERSPLFGLGLNNHGGSLSNSNSDSKKKRSRVIYCHVCSQYKPRSTRARFQVCQHIACYDCVRLALMIQHKYNVKAHCPFCQIELDWNKVKPFIVLFKPKTEAGSNSDEGKVSMSPQKQGPGISSINAQNPNECETSVVDTCAINNSGNLESVSNINPQLISSDLIAQAFECNGVSKEKILKGFFSCYLQKQPSTKNGCILQNSTGDPKELQNTSGSLSSMFDPYRWSTAYNGVGNNHGQYAPIRNSGQHNLLFPALSNSPEQLCGEFLPDVGLLPFGETLKSVNCISPGVSGKEFNSSLYRGNFTISNSGGSHLSANAGNIGVFKANSGSKSNNTNNSSGISNSSSSISSGSSHSSIHSSSSSSINSICSNNSLASTAASPSICNIGIGSGVECNYPSYSHRGGRSGAGAVSTLGLGMVPPGSILSTIYENNRRGFACGLFNPSIPTDGVLIHQGKSSSKNIHLELQNKFTMDNFRNCSVNYTCCVEGSTNNVSSMKSSVSGSSITGSAFGHQSHYQASAAMYGYNCGGSSVGMDGPLLNYDDTLQNSSSFGACNDENVRAGGGASDVIGLLETNEDKQMPNWMITTPCLNMRDILGDWRNSTLLKSHNDMVICSI